MPRMLIVVVGLVLLGALTAGAPQQPDTHELDNGALALSIRSVGGAVSRIVLTGDPAPVNPLHSLGHFLCVDGFGPSSAEERAAGLPMHGEANRLPWELTARTREGTTTSLAFTVTLPLVQEVLRRTYRVVEGEQVLYVDTELESLLAFDRPVNWGEHATIGPPFLSLGTTRVDMSATRAMTRSYASQSATPPHRLASLQPFTWPMAPGVDGDPIDVRTAPASAAGPVGDHTTSLMDPSRRLVFVTALNPDLRLVLGYVFRREDYPWTQLWEYYPSNGRLARGLEFAMQPFDMSRREITDMGRLLDTPAYRWLPAKSRLSTSFLLFYARTPDGMRQVDEVDLANGRIHIMDRTSGRSITLAAARGGNL